MKRRQLIGPTIVLFFGGCSVLANLPLGSGVKPPTISFDGATLVRAPSQKQLHATYCPDLLQQRVKIPGAAALVCRGFFGEPPPRSEMTVDFDLHFKVDNPNQIPLPLADVLAAVTVFPEGTGQKLGAVCMRLCGAGEAGCTGAPVPGSCQNSSRDVRSLSDFPTVATNLLVAGGIAAASGQPLSFTAPQVAGGAQLDVVVRFSIGPEPLLATLRELAAQSVGELEAGREISFRIPFRIEGTIWFDAGSVGRLAVGYGPLSGTWVLPTQSLRPH